MGGNLRGRQLQSRTLIMVKVALVALVILAGIDGLRRMYVSKEGSRAWLFVDGAIIGSVAGITEGGVFAAIGAALLLGALAVMNAPAKPDTRLEKASRTRTQTSRDRRQELVASASLLLFLGISVASVLLWERASVLFHWIIVFVWTASIILVIVTYRILKRGSDSAKAKPS